MSGPNASSQFIQFVLFTNWQLPHVTDEFLAKPNDAMDIRVGFLPIPADLGYHSPIPRYEGHKTISDTCPHLNGRPCYCDGSGLNAEQVYCRMLEGGSDAVWDELTKYYARVFHPVANETSRQVRGDNNQESFG